MRMRPLLKKTPVPALIFPAFVLSFLSLCFVCGYRLGVSFGVWNLLFHLPITTCFCSLPGVMIPHLLLMHWTTYHFPPFFPLSSAGELQNGHFFISSIALCQFIRMLFFLRYFVSINATCGLKAQRDSGYAS